MQKIFALLDGRPAAGRRSLVNGSSRAVDALLDHPSIRAVSFVGSSPVARYVYERCAKAGKRVQCQGGAKNPVVIMPDADMETSISELSRPPHPAARDSAVSASVALPVGEAHDRSRRLAVDAARSRKIGFGLDPGVELGPVIIAEPRAHREPRRRRCREGGTLVRGRPRRAWSPVTSRGTSSARRFWTCRMPTASSGRPRSSAPSSA